MKFAQTAAVRRDMRRSSLNGQTAASGARRVKLPTKMKKTAAARIYGIDWMKSGLRSAKRSCPLILESLGR